MNTQEMHTSSGRIQLSQKVDTYGHVHFSTNASCHEMHDTVYSEAKFNFKGKSRGKSQCHMVTVAING